jgi:glycosyltransferase involved in cell wall biosynthesis
MPVSLAVDGQPSEAPDDGYLLAVGRLVPEKGFDVLVDAVALLNETQRPEVAIVGVGPQRQLLSERARRMGVTLHLPGAVPHAELADWYRNARMVVVPSRREGFGLVAAEAAAMGRTVIGTRVGGIPTVVNDGVSGILIEPDDVEGLKDALLEADPTMGTFGPALVTQLDIESHGNHLRQICEDLLN